MPAGNVMKEFREGTLRSGSANGPKVTNPKQAIAIKISEEQKEGKSPKFGTSKRGPKRSSKLVSSGGKSY